jgi:hypothetical protein
MKSTPTFRFFRVADKPRRLEALPPHARDRSTLRALYHALEDSPGIGGRGPGAEGTQGEMYLRKTGLAFAPWEA